MATRIYDCSLDTDLLTGMRLAKVSLGRSELVVLPTDTVYGIGCDAFSAKGVAALLAAKGRGPQSPPPVLIPNLATLNALAEDIPDVATRLAKTFWPGALTMILRAQPSLTWDLGETKGTVALRMPDHKIALALIEEVGPMAVSSANLTGEPAATTCQQAEVARVERHLGAQGGRECGGDGAQQRREEIRQRETEEDDDGRSRCEHVTRRCPVPDRAAVAHRARPVGSGHGSFSPSKKVAVTSSLILGPYTAA